MLFTLNDIDSTPEDELRQEEVVQACSISPPVQRLDGKQDKRAPPYVCVAQPLLQFAFYTEGFKIKLFDMGGGQSFQFVSSVSLLLKNIYTHTCLP